MVKNPPVGELKSLTLWDNYTFMLDQRKPTHPNEASAAKRKEKEAPIILQ